MVDNMKRKRLPIVIVLTSIAIAVPGCRNNSENLDQMQDYSPEVAAGESGYEDKDLNTETYDEQENSTNSFEISLTNVSVGNSIALGHYQQSILGDKEEIRWKVIDIDEGRALLLSEKILFGQPYNETNVDITWEQSTLRNYLNDEFIKEAFNETESALIQETEIVNQDNNSDGTKGGNNTIDRVFCLSMYEVNTYFASDDERICEATQYARSQISTNGDAGSWWLRSPGRKQYCAAVVTYKGATRVPVSMGYGKIGEIVSDDSIGVRPAMWINIENNSDDDVNDVQSTTGGSTANSYTSGSAGTRSVSLYERLVDNLSEESCYLVIGTNELEKEEALQIAQEAKIVGFPAHAIRLNGKYYVSLGGYDLQDKADEILWYAIDNGYPDARVKYTGPAVANSQISKID